MCVLGGVTPQLSSRSFTSAFPSLCLVPYAAAVQVYIIFYSELFNTNSNTCHTRSILRACCSYAAPAFTLHVGMYGHIATLAREVKKGVDSVEGMEGVLYQVCIIFCLFSMGRLLTEAVSPQAAQQQTRHRACLLHQSASFWVAAGGKCGLAAWWWWWCVGQLRPAV